MRQFFLWICCLWSLNSVAQQVESQRQINVTYLAYTSQDEKALATIETASTLVQGSMVSYRAGRSIILSPGFNAQEGSVLSATIEPISIQNESGMRLSIAPNPVNMSAFIDYSISTKGEVRLSIVDTKGTFINELVKETQESGTYRHNWNSSQLATGVYICVLHVGTQTLSVRVIKQ